AALLTSTLVMTAATSWKFGAILPNRSFEGGFRKLVRNPSKGQRELAAWLKGVCDRLPSGSIVAANSRILAHLGNCDKIVLPDRRRHADYMVFGPTPNPLRRAVKNDVRRKHLLELDGFQ